MMSYVPYVPYGRWESGTLSPPVSHWHLIISSSFPFFFSFLLSPSSWWLGQFLLDVSRKGEAAEAFIQAAHLAPHDFQAVFNAAATLREVKDLERAEVYYRRAVQLRPNDVTVYRNLGALLHLQGRWNEAEDNYKLALEFAPDDETTRINLQRLHHAIQQQQQHDKKLPRKSKNDSH